MNPFERIQNVFGQLNPQQRQQAAAQMMTPQQNQQQMMGLGPQVASPAQEAAQAAPQTGMFAKFNNHLQDNKSAMMAMASGMMGSPGRPGSIGQGFQNYAAGGQLDDQRREKEAGETATEAFLKKRGYGAEDIAFYKTNRAAMAQALKPANPGTTDMRNFEYGLTNPEFGAYQMELAKAGTADPGFNAAEAKAATFADRASRANNILMTLEKQGLDRESGVMSQLPFGNDALSAEYQQYMQAKQDFLSANLRDESGAVIGEKEMADADQRFFPQPGDRPSTIAQKRQAREYVVNGLVRGAGVAYEPLQMKPYEPPVDLSGVPTGDLESIANGGQ